MQRISIGFGYLLKNNDIIGIEIIRPEPSEIYLVPNIKLSFIKNTRLNLFYQISNSAGYYYPDEFLAGNTFLLNNQLGISTMSEYLSNNIYIGLANDDYFYFNLNSTYAKNRLKIGASYTTYSSSESLDGIIKFSDDFQVPFIKNNFNYFIEYELPVDEKAFSFIFKLNGRYLDIDAGAVNFNSLPMIVNYSGNDTIKKNHLDFIVGLKFDNFELSYHSITNNGKNFSLQSPFSDIGTAFDLPQYVFLENEIALFHYLNISWTFTD